MSKQVFIFYTQMFEAMRSVLSILAHTRRHSLAYSSNKILVNGSMCEWVRWLCQFECTYMYLAMCTHVCVNDHSSANLTKLNFHFWLYIHLQTTTPIPLPTTATTTTRHHQYYLSTLRSDTERIDKCKKAYWFSTLHRSVVRGIMGIYHTPTRN